MLYYIYLKLLCRLCRKNVYQNHICQFSVTNCRYDDYFLGTASFDHLGIIFMCYFVVCFILEMLLYYMKYVIIVIGLILAKLIFYIFHNGN